MKAVHSPGTWNHIVRASVRLPRTICDQSLRPSLYRSKLDVVLYDTTKPNTVPILQGYSKESAFTFGLQVT